MSLTNEHQIGIGVIGCGGRIRAIVRGLLPEMGGAARVVSVFDPSEESRRTFSRELGYDFTSAATTEQVINDPSVKWVMIGSWNSAHAEQVIAAYRAGKNIFCEKPLAINAEECLAIQEASKDAKGVLSFGLVMRYSPFYRKVREIVTSEKLGKIVSMEFNETLGFAHGGCIFSDWRRRRANAGPHILEKCCHDLDLANWIVDALPVTVASFAGRDFFTPAYAHRSEEIGRSEAGKKAYSTWADGERVECFTDDADISDNQVAILEYGNGVRATFHTNCNAAIPERRIYIVGTHGTLRGDVLVGIIETSVISWSGNIERMEISMSDDGHGGGDEVMAKSLVESIISGAQPLSSLKEGVTSAVSAFGVDQATLSRSVFDLRPLWGKMGYDPSAFYGKKQ